MNRRSLLTALGAAPCLAACFGTQPTADIRYRLRARLWVDDRQIEATTVFLARYFGPPEGPFASRGNSRHGWVWAEALLFDLAERGLIAGLLGQVFGIVGREHERGHFDPIDPALVIGRALPGGASLEDRRLVIEAARSLNGEQALTPDIWPIFVHFSNPNDLTTACHVNIPGQYSQLARHIQSKTLASVCGDEAQLLGVSVEVTDAPPSDSIRSVLPWLEHIQGSPRNPRSGSHRAAPLHENLSYQHFKWVGR